uniref:Homeobox domain-containing protein n=1 Tax=Electrophorus electricus TaxID=8005 RepID=A0A4W4ENV1_ELEEL
MSAVVFSQFDEHLSFEETGKDVERNSLNYLEVIDGQHPDLLSSHKGMDDSGALKHRRNGGGKVRHKRQALQDMARPLKQWLYKHRDNPYPTKTEKILLALGSHMTLVQVSNWFANARRRLKNTVRQPDLSWALRIKLYNKYVQGNAERLSISSDDSASEDGENPRQPGSSVSVRALQRGACQVGRGLGTPLGADGTDGVPCGDASAPPKYKSSLLHRYLNDSLHHVMASGETLDSRRRNHSGSFSSNEYEDELMSPSPSEAEGHFTYRTESLDCCTHPCGMRKGGCRGHDATYWKEIHAAMALTNLAQSKQSIAPGTTSCIIQKSSHIAEIKTVKVPMAPRH